MIALRNTLTGPRPFLAQMAGDAVTILRSDQFLIGNPATLGVPLRDETGKHTAFPLLIVQPTISNRAPPPNSVGVHAIEGDLAFSRAGHTLFRSNYIWHRTTASSAVYDNEAKVDGLVFESAAQTAPFDLPGGGTWSKEVLLIPRDTWAAVSWSAFSEPVTHDCPPHQCQGELSLRVRLDNSASLTAVCSFSVDEHMLAQLRGVERRYFTSPVCDVPKAE